MMFRALLFSGSIMPRFLKEDEKDFKQDLEKYINVLILQLYVYFRITKDN